MTADAQPPHYKLRRKDEALIRRAAQDALTQTFALLTAEHVIPRSRYRPWIRMARDYYGYAVEGGGGPLSNALEAALPERFGQGSPTIETPDHPWSYASAIVEGAVAAATRADEPYDVRSPSVQQVIDELIATVQRKPESKVLQLVADVSVEHMPVPPNREDRLGETIEIAGVRVVRVDSRPEQFIEDELASAGFEVERSEVFVHPEPASLLVAKVAAVEPYGQRVVAARSRVQRLLTAIRLAAAATAYPLIDIAGDCGHVRWTTPSITRLPGWGYRFVHRPVVLTTADVAGLESLVSLLTTLDLSEDWVAVRIALGRLNRSLDGSSPGLIDQVVDLAVGLEAALSGTDKTEIGLRLRTRAAALLASEDDPPELVYRAIKTLYELRSTFVHGAGLTGAELDKQLARVVTSPESKWPGDRYLLVLDRWRDLLRRAILARLALSTAPEHAWPANARALRFDVDELLLRPRSRQAWQDHIRSYWSDHGLPAAPVPPGQAQFTIGGPA